MTSKEMMTKSVTLCLWSLSVMATTMAVLHSTSTASSSSSSQQGPQPGKYCVPEAWQCGRESILAVFSNSGNNTLKRKVLYTIRGDVTRTCTKTPLPVPFVPECVPDNSTVTLLNSTFGVGKNAVSTMELSGIHKRVTYRVTLTYDTHVPVYEQLWGEKEKGEQFIQTTSFYNMSVSHEIPAVVFKPPSIGHPLSTTLPQLPGHSVDGIQRPLLLMP